MPIGGHHSKHDSNSYAAIGTLLSFGLLRSYLLSFFLSFFFLLACATSTVLVWELVLRLLIRNCFFIVLGQDLDANAPRRYVVTEPLKVVIENLPGAFLSLERP